MKVPFFSQQSQLEMGRGHTRSHSQSGRGLLLKSRLAPLGQRFCRIPHPLARTLRLAGFAFALFLICLILPFDLPSATIPNESVDVGPRPDFTPDLVIKTLLLNDGAAIPPPPPVPSPPVSSPHDNTTVPITPPSPPTIDGKDCTIDSSKIRKLQTQYELDEHIEYYKRYVRYTRKPIERLSYTSLPQKFLPEGASFALVDISTDYVEEKQCPDPIDVAVTESHRPTDVDLSEFLFAIATTVDRLEGPATIQEWAYWLTDGQGRSNGGKLLLRVLDASDTDLRDIAQRVADVGIDAEVSAWDSRVEREMAVRYLELVPLLVSHEESHKKKWLVLCDDDTFFSSINGVVQRFKQYDHTKRLYIGTLSEDIVAVSTHGSQAFGGGGVFLSRPLAEHINNIHDECRTPAKIEESNSGWGPQGDILLRKCIYENTDVRLTQLDDLWQLDLSGDASGFYEAGFKPLSVHHFKGAKEWHLAHPLDAAAVAHTCGEDCTYQRFVTADNFVLTNGYSVAHYPNGVAGEIDLEQVERTFHPLLKENEWNFDYTFGPQRPNLARTGKKVAWELRKGEVLDNGAVSQIYVRRKGDERWTDREGNPMKVLDGIIELVWIPG